MQVVAMETEDTPMLSFISNKTGWNPSFPRDQSQHLDITTFLPIAVDSQQHHLVDSVLLERYMNGFMAIIIIVLGLVGNSLTVIVLTRRTMHSSTNCYLTALAVWDGMVLLGTFCLMVLPQLSVGFKGYVFPYIVKYIYPFALIAQTATLWLTVSFTVERYIAVCHPLKAARMCTIARARLVIAFVSVTSFLFNVNRWFDYEIISRDNNTTNTTELDYAFTDFGKNNVYRQVYFLWLYLFIMFFIPLTSLAVLNTFLIFAVRRSHQQRKDMNVRQSRENNVTIMLVSVVIVFMICQLPALVYNVAFSVNSYVIHMYGWQILSTIRNFMVTFNSAINFILYCAFGQKFRRTFIRTFCRCLVHGENFNSLTYPHSTVLASTTTGNKYRVLKGKKGLHYQMADLSCTHNTLLSKYTPHSRTDLLPLPKVGRQKFENGRCRNRNYDYRGSIQEESELCDMIKTPNSSCPPSPI
ncbi:Hypothetical predicted protein [Mytilus galloprovincialis]|uniref:G-protein coupled receptors family 1 profile domain-containing protein n=2 Tax=Mytilus galloprovincialis TaxID=29158 RepID=A0A8B6DYP4_MYTGA|nr:Hypothetical predicted protein [Mytilus galloprovincialis]